MDHDKGGYLHSGRNSETKNECLLAYIEYRWQDISDAIQETFEISDDEMDSSSVNHIFNKYITEEYIMDDMACCDFSLEEHEELIDEDDY